MRRYETIIILDPDLSEDQRSAIMERTTEVIPQQGGFLAFVDEWGARQLASEIKTKDRGYYVRFDFCGDGAVINEMERFYRIDDGVLKYMTVLTNEAPDLERVKEEIAQVESEKAKAEAKAAEEAQARAEAEAAAEMPVEAEAPAQEHKPAEAETAQDAETPAEAEAPVEAEMPAADELPATAETQAAAEQIEVPEESAPPETESVVDEAVQTDSEEEKK